MIERRVPDTPFWVDPGSVGPDHLTLSPEESHHLLHVHRARTGTPFQAIDGEGRLFECVVESVGRRAAVARIVGRHANAGELSRPIEILVGIPDWGAIEQIVAHGVPLGVCVFDFFPCERSGRLALGPQRLERLGRIARAALKQSRRSRLPAIRSSASIGDAAGALQVSERFFADPEGQRGAPTHSGPVEVPISLAVGPPGGFTEEERRLLLDRRFSPISLGPSRLTTETAAIALISLARNSL